jgi:polysaccharide pyruvyl transferase WcaK-like protein
MKKALIVNDTSYENHYGCELIINNIRELLKKNDIKVIGTNPVDIDWSKNHNFLKKIQKSDLVLVNGEGTLHHSQPRAQSLITIGKYIKENYAIPVVLINTTYQDNDIKYLEYLEYFDLIYVRDSISRLELLDVGVHSYVTPDLTYYSTYNLTNGDRNNTVGFTDSVHLELSEKMYNFSKQSTLRSYMPILSNYKMKINYMYMVDYCKFHIKRTILFLPLKLGLNSTHNEIRVQFYAKDRQEYIENISNSRMIVIGRFHTLCFAIQTLTPFVVIKSKYHKYEGMLADIGLGDSRIIDDIYSDYLSYSSFDKIEVEMIERYLRSAPKKIDNMFREIARIT